MRSKVASPDAVIARIASRQHGVLSTAQLIEAGLDRAGIRRRVQAGRLHRIHRGVYAVGHAALSNEGRWMAAVLACGDRAVLSHRSAAELWGILSPREGPVDVTVRSSSGRARRHGIRLRRSPLLPLAATTRNDGIPVTTPARTIADLRHVATVDEVRRAIREAEFQGLDIGNEGEVERDLTRSKLERRFLSLCRRHRLPKPEVNVKVGPFEVDFLWRDARLVVEVDGWKGHRGRVAFEDDRARDVELRVRGYTVVRFTYRQVIEQPAEVARAFHSLLTAR